MFVQLFPDVILDVCLYVCIVYVCPQPTIAGNMYLLLLLARDMVDWVHYKTILDLFAKDYCL